MKVLITLSINVHDGMSQTESVAVTPFIKCNTVIDALTRLPGHVAFRFSLATKHLKIQTRKHQKYIIPFDGTDFTQNAAKLNEDPPKPNTFSCVYTLPCLATIYVHCKGISGKREMCEVKSPGGKSRVMAKAPLTTTSGAGRADK